MYTLIAFKLGLQIGKLLLRIFKFDQDIFFFFSSYTIGGADRVHSRIVSCLKSYKKIVFFTEKSPNHKFRKFFQAKNLDIYFFYRFRLIFKGLLLGCFSEIINSKKNVIVFGSNSRLFYDLIPYFRKEVIVVDLLHSFGVGFDSYSLSHIKRINKRIVIISKTVSDLEKQYKENNIDKIYLEKVKVVENKVPVPNRQIHEINRNDFTVLFVGRDSPEKRAHMVERIAEKCLENNLPVNFLAVGLRLKSKLPNIKSLGNIDSDEEMDELYNKAAVLLNVSKSEGFPLTVMECMARGVPPIVTDVGGLSMHIKNGINGVLISPNQEEADLARNFYLEIARLYKDLKYLERLRNNCCLYASQNFDNKNYCFEINNFFNELKHDKNISLNGKF